jgi:hypothetical protein
MVFARNRSTRDAIGEAGQPILFLMITVWQRFLLMPCFCFTAVTLQCDADEQATGMADEFEAAIGLAAAYDKFTCNNLPMS